MCNQWQEMTYEQFRTLIDERSERVKNSRDNLSEYFNSSVVTKSNIGKILHEIVCRLVHPLSSEICERLHQFERRAIWEAISRNESIYPICGVIDVLLDAKRAASNQEKSFLDDRYEQSFLGAIAAAVDRVVFVGPLVKEEIYRWMRFRDFDECKAATELQCKGYQLEKFKDERLILSAESETCLFKRLDELMTKIGGRRALCLLWHGDPKFPNLIPLLCNKRSHSRWPLYRIWADDTWHKCQAEQVFPYNYWMNLAVKHFNDHEVGNDEDIAECINLMFAYARFVNVIPSSMRTFYQLTHPKDFTSTLQKIALYSHLYKIDQMRMNDSVDIIESCSRNYASKKVGNSVILAQVICVLRTLMSFFKGRRGPTRFSLDDICNHLKGWRKETVANVLALYIAHGGTPNQQYLNPNKPDGYDFYLKPIIKCGDDYWVVDPSMAASSFLSRFVFSGFLGAELDDRKIGCLVEDVIRERFVKKGLDPKTGFFGIEGGGTDVYEADVILADAKNIVAIEIKKKSMKEDSRCGNTLQLMRDLAAGLLDDIKQARRYLGELIKHGSLTLHEKRNKSDNSQTITYGENVRMTIVAMPLFDFDAFQTPAFTRSFVYKCGESIDVRFTGEGPTPTDEDYESCKKLNKSLLEYQKIVNAYPKIKDVPIAVISIPQMICLLDEIKSPDEFYKLIGRLPRVEFGTFDFYMMLDQQLLMLSKENNE